MRTAELTVGGTVAFAAVLINADGVDFTVLDPNWLPVALFMVIPAVSLVLLCLLAEHWLAPDSWFGTAPVRKAAAVLLIWIPARPLIVLLAPALGIGVVCRHVSSWATEGARPARCGLPERSWASPGYGP